MNVITDAVKRMKQLIADLLDFSSAGSANFQYQSCDLNILLKELLQFLKADISEKKGTIIVDNLPTITCDKERLFQVFQNLIGNALKYHHGQIPIMVKVSAEEQPEEWKFLVRDKGIGIEAQHFEKIFQIFQRLHTQKEFTGTGIGLAICKKIIENHGGEIGVSSVHGQGSTFFFTIPKNRVNIKL